MNKQPVYLKLYETISHAILDGEYADGDLLPSVRAFANEQGANPLTVAKAYQLFQDRGLVSVKRGVGLFVARGAVQKLRNAERKNFIDNSWPLISKHMQRIGLNPGDLANGKSENTD